MTDKQRETDIALMYQDIKYIKKDMADIKSALQTVLEQYMTRKDTEHKLSRLEEEMNKRFDEMYVQINKKADEVELDKVNQIISRINWIIIVAVLGALMGLIFTVQ